MFLPQKLKDEQAGLVLRRCPLRVRQSQFVWYAFEGKSGDSHSTENFLQGATEPQKVIFESIRK